MAEIKQSKPRKIIQTAYGKVYVDVRLDKLENDFDTHVPCALDHVDFVIERNAWPR